MRRRRRQQNADKALTPYPASSPAILFSIFFILNDPIAGAGVTAFLGFYEFINLRKSMFLGVRDQPLYIPGIPFIHDDVFAQFSLPLGRLAGEKMAGIGLGTFNLSGPGQFKTFDCSSFRF
jgi:hypothetical protein